MTFGTSEIGLGAVSDWLATQRGKFWSWKSWALYGTVVGSVGGLGGALTGIIAGFVRTPDVTPGIFAFWFLCALGSLLWAAAILASAQRHRQGGSRGWERGVLQEIWTAWSFGRLRIVFGAEGATKLNEAAALALEAANTLEGPAWTSHSRDDFMAKKRAQIKAAMDSGVIRIAEQARHGADPQKLDQSISEMRAVLAEVHRITKRRQSAMGSPGEADPLRQTLADLREISRAEEEWMQEQQG